MILEELVAICQSKSSDEIEKTLKRKGFGARYGGFAHCFSKSDCDYVVKTQCIWSELPPKTPEYEAIFLHPEWTDFNKEVVIQKKVDMKTDKDRQSARDTVLDYVFDKNLKFIDLHWNNFGWLGEKLVIFDLDCYVGDGKK